MYLSQLIRGAAGRTTGPIIGTILLRAPGNLSLKPMMHQQTSGYPILPQLCPNWVATQPVTKKTGPLTG